ncbi:MAG: hypothetical protein CM15mV100_140 [uncultured marine virus]|nr:MAG: hypothetical protein CM15mV100_140 [uncultured marine virus]
MKFLLIMQVCSALHMSCMDSMEAGIYKTHFDCATAGYLNAIGLTREVGQDVVNRDRITVKFECRPINEI